MVCGAEREEVLLRESHMADLLVHLRQSTAIEGARRLTLAEFLSRPEARLGDLPGLDPARVPVEPWLHAYAESEVKGAGYRERERAEVRRLRGAGSVALPQEMDFAAVGGLSREMVEKLSAIRPRTLGQAARVPGVPPAALTQLRVAVERARREERG